MGLGEEVVEEGWVDGGGVVVRRGGVKFGRGRRDREGSV